MKAFFLIFFAGREWKIQHPRYQRLEFPLPILSDDELRAVYQIGGARAYGPQQLRVAKVIRQIR